jgi:hypothetical protein
MSRQRRCKIISFFLSIIPFVFLSPFLLPYPSNRAVGFLQRHRNWTALLNWTHHSMGQASLVRLRTHRLILIIFCTACATIILHLLPPFRSHIFIFRWVMAATTYTRQLFTASVRLYITWDDEDQLQQGTHEVSVCNVPESAAVVFFV